MIQVLKSFVPEGLKKAFRRSRRAVKKGLKRVFHDGSQSGELRILKKLIRDDYPPYVVDVGANDGKTYSNSYHFAHERGWSALLFEPQPEVFTALTALYRGHGNVVCLNMACSNITGRQKFFIGVNNLTSTLCQEDNKWFRSNRTDKAIEVESDTLTHCLEKYRFPGDISLLTIDTEGMDYEVLLSLDFTRFRPRVIVSEEYAWNEEKHAAKYRLIEAAGYRLYGVVGSNSIWIRNDLAA
jgi:FkbM family methyltransferase